MIVYNVAVEFSRLPGGRFAEHGPHSGEEFLYKHLVPLWEKYNQNQERIQLDFSGCMGCTGGFLDQSIGELAKVFGAEAVHHRFQFVGLAEHKEIDEIIETAAKTGIVLTPEHDKAKATRDQRQHVQDFMEWCEQQDPPLVLCEDDGMSRHSANWQTHCTAWCEIDEDKLEQEKLQILAKQREMNDLFEKAKEWAKKGRRQR